MFSHIFKYRLKCLLRDRTTMFWTMAFPLILATLFYLALSNLNTGSAFEPIPIAVVEKGGEQNHPFFKSALDNYASGDDRLFDLTVASVENAQTLLDEGKIAGYVLYDDAMTLVVKQSGISQNIIKSFLDIYLQTESAVKNAALLNPAKTELLLQQLDKRMTYVQNVSLTESRPDITLNYFYVLIAMACFYGGFFGLREVTDIQANISSLAARVNISHIHKLKAFLSSCSASLLIQFAEMLILLGYLNVILKIDFGEKMGYVLLTTFVGSVTGIAFGSFISALANKAENIKVAILIGSTMFCSFLSGMMIDSVKYIVARDYPILAYINPVNLLTDAFYSLYYYDNYSRYSLNMLILSGFVILFGLGTYLLIRRRKYASL